MQFEVIAFVFRDDWWALFHLGQVCKAIWPVLLKQMGAVNLDKRMLNCWMGRLPTTEEVQLVSARPFDDKLFFSLWILHHYYHYCINWVVLWTKAITESLLELSWITFFPTPPIFLDWESDRFLGAPRYNPIVERYQNLQVGAILFVAWTVQLGRCPPVDCIWLHVCLQFSRLATAYNLDWALCDHLIEHFEVNKQELAEELPRTQAWAWRYVPALLRWLLPQVRTPIRLKPQTWLDPYLLNWPEFELTSKVDYNEVGPDLVPRMVSFLREAPIPWILANVNLSASSDMHLIDRLELSLALFQAGLMTDYQLWSHTTIQLLALAQLVELRPPRLSRGASWRPELLDRLATVSLAIGRLDWWADEKSKMQLQEGLPNVNSPAVMEVARQVLDLEELRRAIRFYGSSASPLALALFGLVEDTVDAIIKAHQPLSRALVLHLKEPRQRLRCCVYIEKGQLRSPADLLPVLDLFSPEEILALQLSLQPEGWASVPPARWPLAFQLYPPSGHWHRSPDSLHFCSFEKPDCLTYRLEWKKPSVRRPW